MTELFVKGDRFQVSETVEIKTPKGALLARYLPGSDYGVTPRNLEFANGLLAQGKASRALSARERSANRLSPSPARLKGAVKVTPKKTARKKEQAK
ncbi:hypothetical protein EMQ25_05760 [Arsenicitalea aurantiaca]|uniref:Uncharacterized protein n=1 Tax=Arsenicitalea aurantiaca TaxID=1783274 RepID=A0A433XEX6_9HYPH|nr:hypothetical protein [Arsenicitalea aurantiaca]RUT32651.1 hypothetical protein EMQ25_05760 [Arsenicitalea aurantiaca]